jgi:hypothetical protein
VFRGLLAGKGNQHLSRFCGFARIVARATALNNQLRRNGAQLRAFSGQALVFIGVNEHNRIYDQCKTQQVNAKPYADKLDSSSQ